MQKEEFRDVLGYEGLYQVSNLGNVKSLKFGKERLLTPNKSDTGYMRINLLKKGKQKTRKIHQLVAETFLNHKPCGYKEIVDHINNNPLDNRLENLQIINHRENCSKDKKNGTSKYIGVFWNKSEKNWVSRIYFNGKRIHLGSFKNEEGARDAYQNKLKEIKD